MSIQADPTPKIKQLMNEPVSAFAFGLYKLEREVAEKYSKFANPYNVETEIACFYIPKTNEIVIHIIARSFVILDKETARKICEDHHSRITHTLQPHQSFEKRDKLFDHQRTLQLKEEIENITVIEVLVSSYKDNPFKYLAHSRNKYKDKKIHFIQN